MYNGADGSDLAAKTRQCENSCACKSVGCIKEDELGTAYIGLIGKIKQNPHSKDIHCGEQCFLELNEKRRIILRIRLKLVHFRIAGERPFLRPVYFDLLDSRKKVKGKRVCRHLTV